MSRARRGSLTGADGLSQEGLDIPRDDAEHLDHGEPRLNVRRGRETQPVSPISRDLALTGPPGFSLFLLASHQLKTFWLLLTPPSTLVLPLPAPSNPAWCPASLLVPYLLPPISPLEGGFPGGPVVKNSPAKAGDMDLIPGSGRAPGEGNGNPLQCSCLGNPMDRGAWRATVHGVAESDTTEHTHYCYTIGSSPN